MQCLEYSPVKYSVLLCRLANKQKSFYSGITDRHIFIYTAIQAGKTTIHFHQPIVMGIKINCIDRGSSTLPFPALCILRTQFICRTFGRNSIRNSALCRCTHTHLICMLAPLSALLFFQWFSTALKLGVASRKILRFSQLLHLVFNLHPISLCWLPFLVAKLASKLECSSSWFHILQQTVV